MATWLKANGEVEEGITDTGLKNLQRMVGGFIETVPTNDGRVMVLNEEGKLYGLPYNASADALARGIVADDDLIVGDVVICTDKEID